MNPVRRIRFALLALAALLPWTPAADAADIVRGKQVYDFICASCHNPGANPGPDFIMAGAGNPAAIRAALRSVAEMRPYEDLVSASDEQDLAAYLGLRFGGPPPPEPPPKVVAFEYYHAEFDHYFVTSVAGEIAKLDDGTFKGWTRTGRQFSAYQAAAAGLSAVCRFFSTAFGLKSSHFYTASAGECTAVKSNPDWLFEDEVFFVALPAADGTCAAGTIPVYRMYNDGQGGAPNHRLSIDLAVRDEMLAKRWTPEGQGIGVTMCAPV